MLPAFSLQNLAAWSGQVALVAAAGSVLPKVLRIRHPRSHLNYCYLLIALCIAIPFLQPLIPASTSMTESYRIAAWLLIAGMLARLGVLAAGLIRLRHYRATAVPLNFPKESILSLCRQLDREVEIGVSTHAVGPVTLGWRRPMILLPDSFLSLEEDSQQAILCHELLHVTRRDWLVHIIEEIVGIVFWFHPAIWWLLSQTKLAREQVVDAEVIRLTAAREPYIQALLAMAGIHPEAQGLPAPLFLRTHHLVRRVRMLLLDSTTSTPRLAGSYAMTALLVGVVSWLAVAAFPLMARSQAARAVTRDVEERALPEIASIPTSGDVIHRDSLKDVVYEVGNGVSAPRVITQVQPVYSDAARLERMEGTIVVEGVVTADGSFVLRSGSDDLVHADLRRSAANALRQWKFEPGKLNGRPVPVRLAIEMNFNLR